MAPKSSLLQRGDTTYGHRPCFSDARHNSSKEKNSLEAGATHRELPHSALPGDYSGRQPALMEYRRTLHDWKTKGSGQNARGSTLCRIPFTDFLPQTRLSDQIGVGRPAPRAGGGLGSQPPVSPEAAPSLLTSSCVSEAGPVQWLIRASCKAIWVETKLPF